MRTVDLASVPITREAGGDAAAAAFHQGEGRREPDRSQGRRAVVTGGAQGIGQAIAERLLRSGAAVALWDQDAVELERGPGRADAAGHGARP